MAARAGAACNGYLHRADGSVVTIWVKKLDLDTYQGDGNFNRIVYNPGIGTLADGVKCMGWTNIASYTVADTANSITFDGIRTFITNKLNEGVTDGTEINFYAMLFKSYTVTYLDNHDAVAGSDVHLFPADAATSSWDYTVNAAYTPEDNESNFEGWKVNSGGSHVDGYTGDEQNYPNATRITVHGNVTFSVNVSKGHWLIYDENGKGATYKAADFVRSGQRTVEPTLPMTRNGYTFVGWWTGAPGADGIPTGSRFEFGSTLNDNTQLYAKWSANTTANYTVIIWKQNIDGDGYDFEEAISLSGTVNSTINTVRQQGSGNTAYVTVNGSNKNYPGFHLDHFDQNVQIKTEGNAVLNVYYDRNEYTLSFQIKNGSSWTIIKTITALYQKNIGSNFPIVGTNGVTYNNGERWDPQSTSGSNDVIVYLDIMPNKNETFRLDVASRPLKTMEYYVEALPDDASTFNAPNTLYDYDNRRITAPINTEYILYKTISARYNGATKDDFIDLLGYERIGSDGQRDRSGFYIYNQNQNGTIRFYYSRKKYPINFMDGACYDGNDNRITEGVLDLGQLEASSDIAYGADISSYANHQPSTRDGFVFEGWCSDEVCTQPYVFNKMPEGGITVYAKWRQIQYRVFLHPNADPVAINDLDWGSEDQAMNFRINYGGTISSPTGRSENYEFVGWYTNEACTSPFNSDAIRLDNSNTTPYDKVRNLTDPMDKWGILGDNPYNSDRTGNNGGDRFWITRKYDIYGKWRAILSGADGINIVYDANGGNSAPDDIRLYQDNVDAIAGQACSHSDDTKEFSHWVMQRWNEERSEYIDLPNSRILPGEKFTVLKINSKKVITEWYNPSNLSDVFGGDVDPISTTAPDNIHTEYHATYTVKLRAEYVDGIQKPTYTFMQWFDNYGGTARVDGGDSEPHTLAINDAVLPPVPTRTGYNFKGWYKQRVASGDAPATVAECTPNFLYYNNGRYYKEAGYTNQVTHVAADLFQPTDYMYAIWEPIVDFTIPANTCQGDPITLPHITVDGVDLAGTWSADAGTVSGTTYTATDVTSATLTFTPESSTCASANSFPVSFITPNLATASSYDYIWKGSTADWNTNSNWYVYDRSNSRYSIATEQPTAGKNIYIGQSECVTANWPSLSNEAYAKNITIASTATLTIPEGKTLNIAGNLDIAAGATFSADNTNSKVVFNGSSDQRINRPVTFRDVKFAQTGVHQITIPEMMTVTGKATFEKGIVNANATFNNDASAEFADGARYNSYVSGTVTKKGNPDSFTFPLGDDGVLGAFTTKIENNTDKGVSIKFNHKRDGEGNGFSIEDNYPRWWNINDMCAGSNALPRFDHVSNYEYWEVVDMSEGTSLSTITLKVDANDPLEHFNSNFSGRDNEKIYAAAHFDCWKNIGGPAEALQNSNQTITVSVSSISRSRGGNFDGIITLGSIDHNTVLPIELTSFSATCDGHSTLVEWTTASEKNNDYFLLERSDDAINFVEIARIAGAGNSIVSLDYSYTDYGVHGGDNYYRLVQVDYDGTRTASEIIVANCSDMPTEEPEVVAYPNPFDSDLTVELENFGDRPARIDVYDVLGRLVYTEEVAAPQNDYQTVLHLGGLSDATYTVRVATSDFVINRKVVKQQ